MILKKIFAGSDNLFSRGAASMIIKVLGAACSYILTFLIADRFGAEGTGVFALFMTYVVISSTIFYVGLDVYLVRYISLLSSRGEYRTVKVFYNKIIKDYFLYVSSLIIIVAFLVYKIFNIPFLFLVGCSICVNVFIDLNSACLRGMKRSEWFSVFTQFSKYFFTILLFLVLPILNNENFFIFLYLMSLLFNGLLSSLVLNFYIKRNLKNLIVQKTVSFSIPKIFEKTKEFFISSLIIIVLVWIDFIFIDVFLEKSEAGIYSVALKIATLISFGFTAFNAFLAPRISELFTHNKIERLQNELSKNFLLVTPLALIPFLAIVFFGSDLLGIFGTEFEEGYWVLIALAVGQFVNCIFGPVSYLLQMTDHQKVFQNILLTTIFLKFILVIFFVKVWGIVGVAIASSIGLILWTVVGSYFVYKKVGVRSWFKIEDYKKLK